MTTKRHRGIHWDLLSVSHLSPVSVINWTHLAFPLGPLATVFACQQLLSAFAQSFICASYFHQIKKTWILCGIPYEPQQIAFT